MRRSPSAPLVRACSPSTRSFCARRPIMQSCASSSLPPMTRRLSWTRSRWTISAYFAPLLLNENVVKLFHAGSQDLEILLREVGVLPKPIFDTQTAAALLGPYPADRICGPRACRMRGHAQENRLVYRLVASAALRFTARLRRRRRRVSAAHVRAHARRTRAQGPARMVGARLRGYERPGEIRSRRARPLSTPQARLAAGLAVSSRLRAKWRHGGSWKPNGETCRASG